MGNRLFEYSFSQLILRQDPPKSSTFDHFPLPPRKRLLDVNLEAYSFLLQLIPWGKNAVKYWKTTIFCGCLPSYLCSGKTSRLTYNANLFIQYLNIRMMKYIKLSFLLSTLLLFSCSSDKDEVFPENYITGSRIKPFSSCGEIESIVSDLLYNNRDLRDESINHDQIPSFRCEWDQEQTYDPNDIFIVRATNVRTNYKLAHLTQEELTYTAYIWVEDEQINRIIIEDINWSDPIPELLDDASVAEMFIQMLVPAKSLDL